MASSTLYLSGKCKWAKLNKPDEKYGNYQIDLFLDAKSLETFNKAGTQLTLKEKGEGPFISLRRSHQKLIKNELVVFGPPMVLDKDENPFPEDTLIGNGSTVTCKVIVYDTFKGKGHRLDKVRVDELVEFKGQPQDSNVF